MTIDDTILRQYSNSPVIKSIIYNFNNSLPNQEHKNQFKTDVMSMNTANSYGLDVLASIVGVSRYVDFGDITIDKTFGFNGQKLEPFNFGTFYNGEKATNTLRLSDDFFRLAVKAKASANIGNGTIKDINKQLLLVFRGRGTPFITDNGNMTINYIFNFHLSDAEKALIRRGQLIPKPSGVRVTAIVINSSKTFGFNGSGCQPFGQGSFFNSNIGLINDIKQ